MTHDELLESWVYLHKWVERGLFDTHTPPINALECIAYHPSAPWNTGRWDVDHKPYAAAFYAKFPKALAAAAREGGDGTAPGEAPQSGDGTSQRPTHPLHPIGEE